MKKALFLGTTLVISLHCAMAYANSETLQIDNLLERSQATIYVESFDVEKKKIDEGGELVRKGWTEIDSMFGVHQIVVPNKKLSLASPLSDELRISAVLVDKSMAVKLHSTLLATNQATVAKQIGPFYRWLSENYYTTNYEAELLAEAGIEEPVKMTIVAAKLKDPQSMFVKGLKGLVAATGIWKTGKDWNKDYADLTPLLTSAMMIQSIVQPQQTTPIMGGSVGAQMYAVETAGLSYGF